MRSVRPYQAAAALLLALALPAAAQICTEDFTLRGDLDRPMTSEEFDANIRNIESACAALDDLDSIISFSFPAPSAGFLRSDGIGAISIAPITDADVPDGITVNSAGSAAGLACTGCVGVADLADESVTEAKLDAVDAPADEECLSYESTGPRFEWQTCGGGGGSVTVEEADGTPSVASVTTLKVNQANGLTVTDLGSGVVRIDSAGGGTGWTRVIKSADQLKTSDTTIADDSQLVIALTSGVTYTIRGAVYYNTTATADLKFTFAGPTGTARLMTAHIAPAQTFATTSVATSLAGTVTVLSTSAGAGYVEWAATIQATSSANFAFRWAQNSSDGTGTTVYAGSYLEYSTP